MKQAKKKIKKSSNYVESYVGYVRENKLVYYNKEKNIIKLCQL